MPRIPGRRRTAATYSTYGKKLISTHNLLVSHEAGHGACVVSIRDLRKGTVA